MAGKVVIKENDMEPEMMQEVSDAVTGGIEGNLVNGILNIEVIQQKTILFTNFHITLHILVSSKECQRKSR